MTTNPKRVFMSTRLLRICWSVFLAAAVVIALGAVYSSRAIA
jgi:hypothetical protein